MLKVEENKLFAELFVQYWVQGAKLGIRCIFGHFFGEFWAKNAHFELEEDIMLTLREFFTRGGTSMRAYPMDTSMI